MYVFGKGKSKTTISAPQVSVPKGTTVLIQGNVMDMSPAQPNTPCVSKESMTTQMEYLHMQLPIDGIWHNETVTGVPVQLLAISENGDTIDLGKVTSDMSGTFKAEWTPPSEGLFTLTATFAGDDSYGSSWAETGLSIGPAAQTIQFPETTPPTDITPIYYGIAAATVAIIIAIALVGVLLLRKRP